MPLGLLETIFLDAWEMMRIGFIIVLVHAYTYTWSFDITIYTYTYRVAQWVLIYQVKLRIPLLLKENK